MKRVRNWLYVHCRGAWLLAAVLGALLMLNLGAARDTAPDRWEYKTVWFRVNAGDDLNELQGRFSTALNREGAAGWEYVGRCGHSDSQESWIDFIVFRRTR
ncbi:MAG: hypothetical protein JXB62_07780 [Pirellulales bacterium]|nr:hypothetical protein [Pirellulales bacterium]